MFVTVMQGCWSDSRLRLGPVARGASELELVRIVERDWDQPRADRRRIVARSCCRCEYRRRSSRRRDLQHDQVGECRLASHQQAGLSTGSVCPSSTNCRCSSQSCSSNVPAPGRVSATTSPRVIGVVVAVVVLVEVVDDAFPKIGRNRGAPACVALGAV